eukprot:scaffold26898_cov107-Isochrysis_galbana.AAC.3
MGRVSRPLPWPLTLRHVRKARCNLHVDIGVARLEHPAKGVEREPGADAPIARPDEGGDRQALRLCRQTGVRVQHPVRGKDAGEEVVGRVGERGVQSDARALRLAQQCQLARGGDAQPCQLVVQGGVHLGAAPREVLHVDLLLQVWLAFRAAVVRKVVVPRGRDPAPEASDGAVRRRQEDDSHTVEYG